MLGSTLAFAPGWAGALRWAAFGGLYLLFAGQTDLVEFGIAAVLATLATGWSLRPGRPADQAFSPAVDHLACWARALGQLAPATLRVGRVFARIVVRAGSPGRAHRMPFQRGAERDPKAAARRTTAILALSFAPDSFVVRAERGRDEVLVHAILPDAGPRDPRWLS